MTKLKDKVALVTGASSTQGIGAAIARRLAAEGARLYLVAEGPEEGLRAVATECSVLCGSDGAVDVGLFDLALEGSAERMIEAALARFGRIDILVNNAGVRARKRIGEFSRQDFNQAVAVNLAAPFFATQAVIPAMRRQGGGRIIHIASQMGLVAHDKRAVYGMTKAGLIHLARAMAYELAADKILVNAISPGPVMTGHIAHTNDTDPQLAKDRLAYLRTNRYGTAEEIAEVAHFLATAAPEFLMGQNIVVDGGYTIH